MKVYLDNCSLQRPLDDQTQLRIEHETNAIIEILLLCESGNATLVSSETLQVEINEIQDMKRKTACLGILEVAKENVVTDLSIERRALGFEKTGIKQFDALHLASAEAGGVDFFCTCDDDFLKKAKELGDLKVKAVSPIELLEEI